MRANKDSIPVKVCSITSSYSMLDVVVMLWVSSHLGLAEPFHGLSELHALFHGKPDHFIIDTKQTVVNNNPGLVTSLWHQSELR